MCIIKALDSGDLQKLNSKISETAAPNLFCCNTAKMKKEAEGQEVGSWVNFKGTNFN